MSRRIHGLASVLVVAFLAASCAPPSTPAPTLTTPPTLVPPETESPTATKPPTLIPPDSDSPAAGICGPMEGQTVTFTVSLDVPSPRCAQVSPSQRLEIVNPTDAPVVVTFAGRDLSIEAAGSFRIDEPFGSYLAPGVHFIYVTQGIGNLPELWLLPE